MKIYFSHASRSNIAADVAKLLKHSKKYDVVLPHQHSIAVFDILPLFRAKVIDLVVAEVSEPSTGQGIELAWAAQYGIPIVCVHKSECAPSTSLCKLTETINSYRAPEEVLLTIENYCITTGRNAS